MEHNWYPQLLLVTLKLVSEAKTIRKKKKKRKKRFELLFHLLNKKKRLEI